MASKDSHQKKISWLLQASLGLIILIGVITALIQMRQASNIRSKAENTLLSVDQNSPPPLPTAIIPTSSPSFTLTDKTANRNNLTNRGTVKYTANTLFSQSAIAADFDKASSQYAYINDTASLSIKGDLTMEFGLKLDSLPSAGKDMMLVGKWDNNGNQKSYIVFLEYPNNRMIVLYTENGVLTAGEYTYWRTNEALVTGEWHRWSIVIDASASNIDFYKDGVEVPSTAERREATSIFDGTAPFALGANFSGSAARFMDGKMDDVRIWNTARTAAQINTYKNIELTGSEAGLAAYYPFETP